MLKLFRLRECCCCSVVVVDVDVLLVLVHMQLGISMASVKVPPIHRVRLSNVVRERDCINVRPVRRTVTHLDVGCDNSDCACSCAESIVVVL